jgi:hypothetical protein
LLHQDVPSTIEVFREKEIIVVINILGQAGKISSFNFDGQGQNQYGKNLKYTICLERPSTACEVILLM